MNRNQEHYQDSTAHEAISHVTHDEREDDKRAHRLIKYLKYMIEVNGYRLIGRIEIVDRAGREYR